MSLCLLIHADSTVLWLEIVWSVFTGSIYIYICVCVCVCMYVYMYVCCMCIYIYMGIVCFTAPTQCVQVISMRTFERCCARVRDVAHVSQHLCTCHRSCARLTSPLITFVFHCIHTERIIISKSIGATKRVLPIYIYKHIKTYKNTDKWWYMHVTYITVYSFIFNHILPKSAFRFVSRGSCGEMHQKCQKIKESWKCPK